MFNHEGILGFLSFELRERQEPQITQISQAIEDRIDFELRCNFCFIFLLQRDTAIIYSNNIKNRWAKAHPTELMGKMPMIRDTAKMAVPRVGIITES